MSVPAFSRTLLAIDAAATADRIEAAIRRTVLHMRRRGVVVALSGGIDSSVVGALAPRALRYPRVLGLFMPEADTSPDRLHAVAHFPTDIPYGPWLNLLSGSTMAMLSQPDGPKWSLDLEGWGVRVYVIDKTLK